MKAPTSQAITGVIDFGSAGLSDPAVDLAAASTIDPRLLALLSPTYPEVEPALERIAFYRGTFKLQYALFGAEYGDQAAFEAGMRSYR